MNTVQFRFLIIIISDIDSTSPIESSEKHSIFTRLHLLVNGYKFIHFSFSKQSFLIETSFSVFDLARTNYGIIIEQIIAHLQVS